MKRMLTLNIVMILILIGFSSTMQGETNLGVDNLPPNKPEAHGNFLMGLDENAVFYGVTTDPDGSSWTISYKFDFGDGDGTSYDRDSIVIHSFDEIGTYQVRVRAKDWKGAQSEWSDPLTVTVKKHVNHENYIGGYGFTILFKNHFSFDIHDFKYNITCYDEGRDDFGVILSGNLTTENIPEIKSGESAILTTYGLKGFGMFSIWVRGEYDRLEDYYSSRRDFYAYKSIIIMGPFVWIQKSFF